MQIGFVILEWSKLHMYRTYAQLKDRFGARMRLLYTDTDSFIMQLFGDAQFDNDVYKEIKETPDLRGIFDLSNVPVAHPSELWSPDDPNAAKLGFFKSETMMDPIVDIVALRPKMYSYTVRQSLPYALT